MEFSKVFTFKKELSEQQFLRNVLIGLSKDKKSPANIMNAKFGKVTEFHSEFLVLSAGVEVNYSGSCGYDRVEAYQTTESKYVREGEYYTCNGVTKRASYNGSVQVDVVKERTVTDWRPHSGTLNISKTAFSLNEDKRDEEFENLLPGAVKEAKDESVVEEGTATVNSSAYQSALESCKARASREVDWPGDRHKDTSYSYMVDIKSLECYIVPCYMVEFEYNRKKYYARGLAIGKANEVHNVPKADSGVKTIEIIERRREQQVNYAEKPLKIKKLFMMIAWIMCIVGFYGLTDGTKVFVSLGFISALISIVIAVIINNKVKKAIASINAKAYIEKKELNYAKVNNLVAMLKKLNLPALSISEKNGIGNDK